MYDYDACLIYYAHQAQVADEVTQRLASDARLNLKAYEWVGKADDPVSTSLRQVLNRSAACIIFLDQVSVWDVASLQQEIRARVGQRSLRLIFFRLSERALPQDVEAEAVGRGKTNRWHHLETAIVGFKRSVVTYPIDPDLPDEIRLGAIISGTFLPTTSYVERPEDKQLRDFWQDATRFGVLSLIGMGGSGKTTLLLRFLEALPNHPLSNPVQIEAHNLAVPNGIFLWSFYDNPNIEYFIRGLYEQVTGEATTDAARDVTYRLITHLEQHPTPRLLIALDGLEIVQEEPDSLGEFGLLRDSSLRHFVRRIARGDLPIKMIVTSRAPLPELQPFENSGYWVIDTNTLDDTSAINFLRERGVIGADDVLTELIAEFGSHCLTLDHLARVIVTYLDGKLDAAKQLPVPNIQTDDSQGAQLVRVLAVYAQHLSDEELAILQMVSLMRKPVSVKLLVKVIFPETTNSQQASEFDPSTMTVAQIRDKLRQMNTLTRGQEGTLQHILGKLHALNLIAFYGKHREQVCKLHPAVREYFSQIIIDTGDMHDAIYNGMFRLFVFHTNRDSRKSNTAALFDICEWIIRHQTEHDENQSAQSVLFWYNTLGGYQRVAWNNAAYQRGLRLTQTYMDYLGHHYVDVTFSPLHEHNLFLIDAGQPALAETQTRLLIEHCRAIAADMATTNISDEDYWGKTWNNPFGYWTDQNQGHLNFANYEGSLLQTLCDALIAQGKVVEVESLLSEAIEQHSDWSLDGGSRGRRTGSNPYGRRALARFYLGEVDAALADFQRADIFAVQQTQNHGFGMAFANWYHKAFHARLLARLGQLARARQRLASINAEQMRTYRPLSISEYDLTTAEIAYFAGNHTEALAHIKQALAWAMQSGQQQVYAQAQIQLARQYLVTQNHDSAQESLAEALATVRKCNFNLQLVDALVLAGYLAVDQNDLIAAQVHATEARTLSDELQYGWGRGDSTYLLAKIYNLKNDPDNALDYAQQSLTLRQKMQDPRLKHTQALIQFIQAT